MRNPTIRGIFVNSHINAVRNAKGDEGVRLLEMRYGKPLNFGNTDRVPIREEVRILEIAISIVNDRPLKPDDDDFEIGRFHFSNFATTPLGKFLISFFKDDFKLIMTRIPLVANYVFDGVDFQAEDLGPNTVKISISTNDYPLGHFKGIFHEWMLHSGKKGTVEALETPGGTCHYIMTWE